jgi:fucose 4-O-acetylase-like acetyltransferase
VSDSAVHDSVAPEREAIAKGARDPRIDALRCVAILLVVLGHSITVVAGSAVPGPGLVSVDPGLWVPISVATFPLLSIVYSFSVPLFAFVSGLVTRRGPQRSFAETVRRRALGLLVPYFCWFFVYYGLSVAAGRSVPPFGVTILSVALDPSNPRGLWYLYAIFVCAVVLDAVARLPRPRGAVAYSVAAAVVVGCVPAVGSIGLLGLNKVLWVYPFFAAGYLVSTAESWVLSRRLAVVAGGSVVFAALAWARYPVHVWNLAPVSKVGGFFAAPGSDGAYAISTVATTLVSYACAVAACLALYALYLGFDGGFTRAQAWVGRRALGVYAMHGVAQIGLVEILGIRWWPAVFVLSAAASIGVTLVIERIPVANSLLLGSSRPGRGPSLVGS